MSNQAPKTLIRLFFLLLTAFSLASCAGSKEIRQTEVPDNFSLSLERTLCFGRCPAYKVEINPAGEVTYEAVRFAPDSSLVPRQLKKRELKELVWLIRQADLSQYQDRYDAEVSDLPSVELYCKLDDLEKDIVMRYQTPPKLDSLVQNMEKIIFGNDVLKY